MEELYKLILVDDEDEIRGRIVSMITEDTGFQVVASASNGYDAFELIEVYKPHALITDIRMPYIDGITLAQELRSDFSNIKVVFLTGYSEFDYARKAVELDVISYIMKPATKEDVLDCLSKLKHILDEEYNLIHNLQLLENNIEKNKQLFVEKQFNTFLMQGEVSTEDIQTMEVYGLQFHNGEYVIGIIEFFNNNSVQNILKSETFIREYIASAITQYDSIIPFSTSEGLAFLIKADTLSRREIEFTISKLLANKEKYDSVMVRVGLSSIFNDFTNFSNKYQEASTIMALSRFTNSGTIVAFDDVEPEKTLQIILTTENIKELEYVIRFENEDAIISLFDRYIAKSKTQGHLSVDHQLYMLAIANILLRYALSLGVELNLQFKGGLLGELLPLTSIEEILLFAKAEILKLRRCSIAKANTRIAEIADRVIAYIDSKYTDSSLNLDTLADQFNISVSYLSSVLKKEKGISFSKYLIQVRINHAKELLKYSDLKVVEVAKEVGYNDVYYFSHSFKKNTKMSPKEYREHESV